MQRSTKTNKTTLRSEGRSALKKGLTEPTLLEMSGLAIYRDLARRCQDRSNTRRFVTSGTHKHLLLTSENPKSLEVNFALLPLVTNLPQ